jgi:Activator of Hsp90 ATPase homolog 1-like protein
MRVLNVGRRTQPVVDLSIDVRAPPTVVLNAFFDADALARWWHAARSVTTPRMLGPYAVEWPASELRDDVLGRLGGVLRGTVMQVSPIDGFFVADVYWLPPDGDPIGPMALEVTFAAIGGEAGPATRVRVTQRGFEESARWRRYYEVISATWERALASLKVALET